MKNTSGSPLSSASRSATSMVRITSASGLVRIRQMNFLRTVSDGVPHDVPSTMPGKREAISTTSFHSGIGGARPVAGGRVRAAVDEQRALEGDHDRAVLVVAARAHGDDADVLARLGVAYLEHLGLGVDRVALEHR